MYKVVTFSSTGSKTFATSTIKNRVREAKKSMRVRFRQLIKDYKQMFDQGKDEEELMKLFRTDLVMLLSEALKLVSEGSTLNQVIGLTQLVPEARKISNKMNIVTRKTVKYLNKNGYLNKMLQVQFQELLTELIDLISSKVKDIPEDQLGVTEELGDDNAPKKFSSTKLIINMSEEEVEDIMENEDLDDVMVTEVGENSTTIYSDELPKQFSAAKSYSKRVRCFNSDQKAVVLRTNQEGKSDTEALIDILDRAKDDGLLIDMPDDFNMDVNHLENDVVEYKVYLPSSMVVDPKPIDYTNNVTPLDKILDKGDMTPEDLLQLEDILLAHPEFRDDPRIPESIKELF